MPLTRMQQRRDTAANWLALDPILLDGEIGVDEDTDRIKIGDGVATWSALPYADRLEESEQAVTAAQAAAVAAEAARAGAVAVSTAGLDPANKALIEDPNSDTAQAVSALVAAASRVMVPEPNPFVLERNTPGNPAPYVIGTDDDRVFYAGLQSGGIGYGRYVGDDFGWTGGQPTPTGVTYDRCFQIVTWNGYHYLLCQTTASLAGDKHMSIFRTPVLPLTADSGWAWVEVHQLSADANGNGIATQMCVTPGYMFVSSYADPEGGPSVWRTATGVSWDLVLHDPDLRHHHAIEGDPYNPGHVWLTSGDSGAAGLKIRRSTDDGESWETIENGPDWQAVQISFHRDFVAFASDNGAMTWAVWDRAMEELTVGSPNWHYNTAVPRGTRSLADNPYTPTNDAHYSLLAFFGAVDPETGFYYACANQADSGDWNGVFVANGPGLPLTLLHRGLPAGGNLNSRVFIWRDRVFCGLWNFPRLLPTRPAPVDTTPTDDTAVPGYDVIVLAGQSNMSGRGAIDPLVDVRHPKVWQYASDGAEVNRRGRITTADEPLGHADRIALGNTLGPGGPFAAWYADTIPSNRRVLLVPTAFGGTGFSTSSPNDWRDEPGSLYRRAIAQANAAVAAAGEGARLAAILWVQGEADAEGDPYLDPPRAPMAPSAYQAALDALVTGFRSSITGAAAAPFVIGRMAPGFVARGSNHQAIDAVHLDTPNRLPAVKVTNGPGGHDDGTHYDATGIRGLGYNMFTALVIPPPAPASFIDSFNRANSSTTLGPSWTVESGTFGVEDGAALLVTIGNSGPPWDVALHDCHSANLSASWSLAGSNLDLGDLGVVFRASDPDNYWLTRLGSDGAQVYKVVNGSPSSVGSFAAAHSVNAQDVTVLLNGSSITIKVGGTVATVLDDAFNVTATQHGIWASQLGNSRVSAVSFTV